MAHANSVEGQRLARSLFRDGSTAELCFENVSLKGAHFQEVSLSNAVLDDANFSNGRIANSWIDGLVIRGYYSQALSQPLLERDAKARKPD